MKDLVVDARPVGPHGIGRFARHMVEGLSHARLIRKGGFLNHPFDPVWLRMKVRQLRPDVFLTPSFIVPLGGETPVVPTLHDLIHLRIPDEASRLKRMYYQRVLLPHVRKAPTVLTVSEHSKAAIVQWSGVGEERVQVVGNGVELPFGPLGPRQELERPFVLMVGATKPHKNARSAFRAFARSRACRDHLLCIRDREHPLLRAAARDAGIHGRLVFIPQQDDAGLASLYRGATCLLMPSLMEGFGLPALEALACGTPVVTSRGTAVEEVVGNAAWLVDPLSVDDITAGLDAAVERPDRYRVAAGLERAATFTWDSVRERIHAISVRV